MVTVMLLMVVVMVENETIAGRPALSV